MTGSSLYYVHHDGTREGPLDMPAIMRKIRTGRITHVTVLSTTDDPTEKMAVEHPEIYAILREMVEPKSGAFVSGRMRMSAEKRFVRAWLMGWRFVGKQPIVFVIASTGIMAVFVLSTALSRMFTWHAGLASGIFLYLLMQSVAMVMLLRLYRGQYINISTLRRQILPLLPPLILTSITVGLLGTMGLAALILPGIFIFSIFAFVPFIISDRNPSLASAMQASVMIAFKDGFEGFGAVMGIVCINLLSLLLIITLPITLPIVSLALAELYEDMSH